MRYGIPLLAGRVAPRCQYADSVLLAVRRRSQVRVEKTVPSATQNLAGLAKLLAENRIDTLVCCGITREEREFIHARKIDVIDNVVGNADEVVSALQDGHMQPGYGFLARVPEQSKTETTCEVIDRRENDASVAIDCLRCRNRVCLTGRTCNSHTVAAKVESPHDPTDRRMLEAAVDIACEDEPTLCRLSELIYFCLEMDYKKLGVAFCLELEEPTEILVQLLRRFFLVIPVCCKVGGLSVHDPVFEKKSPGSGTRSRQVVCNPRGQADVLNGQNTDLNVMIGMCMGADCVFSRASQAPVTTLFVKDRSLANNPIGALYSDYYLKEAVRASEGKVRP